MTNREKKAFVNNHINLIRKSILKKCTEIPDHWEGLELKWLVEDYFKVRFTNLDHYKQRRKSYNMDLAKCDLL